MTGPRPLLWIEWEDACGVTSEWEEPGDVTLTTVPVVSIGWLISEDNDVLVIASHVGRDSGDKETVIGCFAIPRSQVRSFWEITL